MIAVFNWSRWMASSTAGVKSQPEANKTGEKPAAAAAAPAMGPASTSAAPETEQAPQGPFKRFWHFIRPILILVVVLFAIRS